MMNKHLAGALAAFAVLGFLFAATPARADEQSEIALATQVVEAAGMRTQVLQGIELVMPMARQQLRSQAPGVDADRFISLFREEVDRMMPSLLSDIAKTYVEQFTEEELAQLSAFYQSPIGRSLVAKAPTLTSAAAQIGQQYGALAGAAAARRLLAETAGKPPANP